jgi:hypothetical protein
VLGLWTLGSSGILSKIEEEKYQLLGARDGYELRRYEPLIMAQTPMATLSRSDTGAAFRYCDSVGMRLLNGLHAKLRNWRKCLRVTA